MKPDIWSYLRLAAAALIAAAIVAQLWASVATTLADGRDLGTVIANFFSFFTILSNTLSVGVLAWAGLAGLRRASAPGGARAVESAPLAVALASVSTYMVITGVVYNTLLRSLELPQGSEPVPWSNEVLHLIGPLFLVADVLFAPFRRALPWRAVAAIIVFPLVWVAYTLVRGPLVTNPVSGAPYGYPYPFLNPNNPGGWGSVWVYIAIIAVAFVLVASVIVWIGRLRAGRR